MQDLTITELVTESYGTAKEKGWWDDESGDTQNFGMKLMLMVSELSEALEEYRHGRSLTEIWYQPDGKPEGIPVELVDVMIRIFDLAGRHNMPMLQAFHEKLAYNKTRPYRHGGKKA